MIQQRLSPQCSTKARGGGLAVPLKEIAGWCKQETLDRITQLSHQEVLRFAKVEEVLDSAAILLGEVVAMRAIKRVGLLERGDLLVGNKELEIAAIVIRQDQYFIAGRLGLTSLNAGQACSVNARRRRNFDNGFLELSSVLGKLGTQGLQINSHGASWGDQTATRIPGACARRAGCTTILTC